MPNCSLGNVPHGSAPLCMPPQGEPDGSSRQLLMCPGNTGPLYRRPVAPSDRACSSKPRLQSLSKAADSTHTAFKPTQAYLLLILMEWGYSLFQIGVLHSVTFAFTYVFEVPSGLIADHFGKKNELLLCFVWYMLSFAFYSFGESSFWVLVLASGFYGLGEAFRSGTHKAMICAWLDKHEIGGHKKLQPRPQRPHTTPTPTPTTCTTPVQSFKLRLITHSLNPSPDYRVYRRLQEVHLQPHARRLQPRLRSQRRALDRHHRRARFVPDAPPNLDPASSSRPRPI